MSICPLLPGRRQHRILQALERGPLTFEALSAQALRDHYSRSQNYRRTRYAVHCLTRRREIALDDDLFHLTATGRRALVQADQARRAAA